MNVTVIGFGGMGQVMALHLAKKHHVKVHDRKEIQIQKALRSKVQKADSLETALEDADVLFICIRGPHLAGFLSELEKHVGSNQLVVDISSVKTPGMKRLKKMPCRVASVHPLFGPKTEGLEEKDVIVISDIGTKKDQELAAFFFHPAKTAWMTVKAHDRLMAELQALPLILNLAFAQTLSEKPEFFPPNFSAQWKAAEKIFSDDPALLDELLSENPYVRSIIRKLEKTTESLRSAHARTFHARFNRQKARLFRYVT